MDAQRENSIPHHKRSLRDEVCGGYKKNEPPHDKINKMACALSEDSDQPGRVI